MTSTPLPGGEREGPAPPLPAAWEGEGGLWHRTTGRATDRARDLRAASTDAERKLWSMVRGSQLSGFKFRRQVPIGQYIADFVCPARKVIVEVDGGQHTVEADARRTVFLESQGYRVLRFWNREVLTNSEGVWRMIAAALSPLPEGEREGPARALPREWEGEGGWEAETAVAADTTTPTRAALRASLASPLQGEEEKC